MLAPERSLRSLLVVPPLRRCAVPRSIIEAIKQGDLTFEPNKQPLVNVKATKAMPGTTEKLDVLASRVARGEPLWHPGDRQTYDDGDKG
jgi:hypothetical protein